MQSVSNLRVHPDLYDLASGPLLKALDISEAFWAALAQAVTDFTPATNPCCPAC